jgi:N-acetyl sugar amidotransferase
MDDSDGAISFDAEGHCNHCRDFLRRLGASRRRLEDGADVAALVARIRRSGEGADYDCVIGISGGCDSSYAAYLAVSLGLRVLAVHMDNGWDTALAVRNVKRLVDRLGVDYVSVVLDWEQFRDLQLAFFKASVPEIETPTDVAIPAALHQVAVAYGVKYIISGGNTWTEGILPKSWHYDPKDMRYLRAIHARYGTRSLRSFPTFGYGLEAYYKLLRGVRTAYLLEHVRYRAHEAAARLSDELGWQAPAGKHYESTVTRFVQSYVLPMKFGIDYRRATLSTRICFGDITRAEALSQLERPPFDAAQLVRDKQYVARKFGITVDELERILALPPKTYRAYPNDQHFLERLYSAYRVLFSSAAT